MRKEENYFLTHYPLLCGMMKYEMYLQYHAAGMKHESQSLAICMICHIYTAGRLLNPGDPVWPDIQLVLYAQDPDWLFVGGLLKMLKDAERKFLLASGSSAVNMARDTPIKRLKVGFEKLREFRDSSQFGNGVYLPGGVGTGKIDVMVKRLLQTMRPESGTGQPWGRLAKQHLQSLRTELTTTTRRIDDQKAITPKAILENFAMWLQADTTDLLFDWLQMQRIVGQIWINIFSIVQHYGNWDPDTFDGNKPALELTLDILTRDRFHPRFLKIAYEELMAEVIGKDDRLKGPESLPRGGDRCLINLAKNHKKTAEMLDTAGGPLSLETLYNDWEPGWWRPRWDAVKNAKEDDLRGSLISAFYDQLAQKH